MTKVIFYHADELLKSVSIHKGQTILRAAKQGRVALQHRCGGKAQCTTCKVMIEDQSGVSSAEDKEIKRLGCHNIAKGMRLSCQTEVIKEVEVVIPEDPYKARIRALLAEQKGDNL
ncbi:2Fe-2S iron-sulfur cluster-binding protein [Virgibacillus sp. W0181]|uniref:2Fe-2S iron-sulfur cluster-binding protein n=1 Tax=Virgibacillus sp. W0181 TaxID=3391581 RepID=UPI003F48A17F